MRKLYSVILFLFFAKSLQAQIINFPDAKFKEQLLMAGDSNNIAQTLSGSSVIDVNHDGEIEVAEAIRVYRLNIQCDQCTSPNNIQD